MGLDWDSGVPIPPGASGQVGMHAKPGRVSAWGSSRAAGGADGGGLEPMRCDPVPASGDFSAFAFTLLGGVTAKNLESVSSVLLYRLV